MAGTDLVELTTLDPTILLDVRYARELRFADGEGEALLRR